MKISEKSSKQCKVLLVEDNATDMLLIQAKILDIFPSCEITSVTSVGDAYEMYKKNDFNLIFLDLNLPDGHGPITVREFRNFNRNIPIVVITASETDKTVHEAIKFGANDVVFKSQLLSGDFENILNKHIKI